MNKMVQFHPREGYNLEKLANYLLSKICFVAEPTSISEDYGLDFNCTFIKFKTVKKRRIVYPERRHFTIQIKKNKKRYGITNIDIFDSLPPYFFGFIDSQKKSLSIYSGEVIPHFLTHYGAGYVKKVFVKVIEDRPTEIEDFIQIKKNKSEAVLLFPKVFDIDINFDPEKKEDNKILDDFKKLVDVIQGNYTARNNKEYIFSLYKSDRKRIYRGEDSFETFKGRFFDKLRESLSNIEWGIEGNKTLDNKDLEFFQEIAEKFLTNYPDERGVEKIRIYKDKIDQYLNP